MQPNENELLEQYIDALLDNEQAAIPAGLNPELANFVRTLVKAQSASLASSEGQSRVWRKTLVVAKAALIVDQEKERSMQPATRRTAQPRPLSFLTALAAVFVVAVFSVAIYGLTLQHSQFIDPGPRAFQMAAATITQLALEAQTMQGTTEATQTTLTATPAMIPTVTIIPTVTMIPTIVPLVTDQSINSIPALTAIVSSQVAAQPMSLATPVHSKFQTGQWQANYSLQIPQDGMLDTIATSPDLKINLSYRFSIPGSENSDVSSGDSGGGTSMAQSELLAYVKAGTVVTLTVSSQSGAETGSFTLTAREAEAVSLSPDHFPGGDISAEQPLQFFTFKGSAGDMIDISVLTSGAASSIHIGHPDLIMYLQELGNLDSPSGHLLNGNLGYCTTDPQLFCSDDDSGRGFDPELTGILLRRTGMYGILIRGVTDDQVGKFNILTENTPPSGFASPLQLSWKQPAATYLGGKANQKVTLQGEITSGLTQVPIRVTVEQNGQILATGIMTSSAPLSQSFTFATDGDAQIFAEYLNQPPFGLSTTIQFSTP